MKNEENREATPAETDAARRRELVRTETAGMAAAYAALQPLDYESRRRALRWLTDALDNVEVPF